MRVGAYMFSVATIALASPAFAQNTAAAIATQNAAGTQAADQQTADANATAAAVSLDLGTTYTYRGRRHSYFSASCPAPPGSGFADIPFVRTRLGFADRAVEITVRRSCRVSEPAGG